MGRNKKIFIFFGAVFFLCAVFWLVPHLGFAADAPKEETPSGFFGYMFQAIQSAISWLLYKVFQVLVWVAAAAIGLFGFAINADLISGPTGLLNQPVIYELWKFIRDFCNIFFILMLLIGAFSMVFQLSSYNAKKTLLSIILAALFVNFSFPLSRVLIDVSNVPTYFFAQQTLGSSGGKSVSQVAGGALLSATMEENCCWEQRKGCGGADSHRGHRCYFYVCCSALYFGGTFCHPGGFTGRSGHLFSDWIHEIRAWYQWVCG
jgi:hypothetical protein